MANMAAGTSAVNQQLAILEMRRKLVQVKTSGNVIGDALVSYCLFSPVPINSPRCPRSSPRSKRLRRKERPRNGIFGFGRTRNEMRAKKLNWGGRGVVRVTLAIFARCLTLVLRSLLRNRTETNATQAIRGYPRSSQKCLLDPVSSFLKWRMKITLHSYTSLLHFHVTWSAPGLAWTKKLGVKLSECLDPLLKILYPLRSKTYFVFIFCRCCTTCLPSWEWSYSVV